MTEPKRIELPESEANALLQRLQQGTLIKEDYALLGSVLKSWLWLKRRKAMKLS